MRESAIFLAVVLLIALAGAAIGFCAGPSKAMGVRYQSVRLPVECHPYEADNDPEGEPIRVYSQPDTEYWLVSRMAGVTTVLAKIPCSTLPRVVQIGGVWTAGEILGCVLDVCEPAVRP